ncbi:conserved hypothetical protein [Rhodospirillaceae bacterium LM-1]|nr:conserved hypothetical protein [Rhodospirillaceae bacterium LM-1]
MSVELARVQPGARPFNARNINDTWLGVLDLADGTNIHAVLKDIYPKEMANELIGASLAIALGLPVPRIFLAAAKPDVLPAEKALSGKGFRVLFASELKGTPSLMQYWTGVGEQLPQSMLEALISWAQCGSAFAFDTWAANVDRNIGNLLFGGPNDIWLIDHGHIFTGQNWSGSHLKADSEYRNRMSEWLTPKFRGTQKGPLLRGIINMHESAQIMDIDGIISASRALEILTPEDAKAMLTFLKDRVEHVPNIATKQAGIPRLL